MIKQKRLKLNHQVYSQKTKEIVDEIIFPGIVKLIEEDRKRIIERLRKCLGV